MNHAIYDRTDDLLCLATGVNAALFSQPAAVFFVISFYCQLLLSVADRQFTGPLADTNTENVDWTSVAAINIILAISGFKRLVPWR